MEEVFEFLRNCKTFYLATCDNGQPHVRPFGAVCIHDGKLYIVTNNQKKFYKQMLANPKIEICGMYKGSWIRVEAEVIHDPTREARVSMMNENEASLSSMYTVDDNLMEVLYLKNATATIYSFTDEPKIITF